MSPRRALAEVLRDVRHAAGVSQVTWAAALNTSPSAVQRWEQGQVTPTAEVVARYARAVSALRDADLDEVQATLGALLLQAAEEGA